MNPKILKFVVTGLIVLFAVFFDQWTKNWADTNLANPHFPEHTVSVTVDNAEVTPTLEKLVDTRYPNNTNSKNQQIAWSAVRDGQHLNPSDTLQNGDVVEFGNVSLTVIENHVEYIYARNKGAAFSFLADKPDTFRSIFFGITGVLAVILILVFIGRSSWKKNKSLIIALAIILGGALGNIIDRVRLGYVIDFVSWYINIIKYTWPTFNVADVFVCAGIAFLILDMIVQSVVEKKAKKAVANESKSADVETDKKDEDEKASA